MNDSKKLMEKIGYHFQDITLYRTALTHSSYSKDLKRNQNYERLEFLGDRVLGLIISDEIYRRFSESTEGELAKKLSFLVCKATLKKIAKEIMIEDFIIYSNKLKKSSLDTIKANSLEALIGGIYLDSDIKMTSKVVLNLWKKYIDNIDLSLFDPKSRLQEWCLKKKKKLPVYQVLKKIGPDHNPTFKIKVLVDELTFSLANGKSKQDAEINAASKLLKEISE
jgi:ribonuclease-3